MLKRHEVEILLKAGHGKAEVARLAGVSLCSVKRITCGACRHVDMSMTVRNKASDRIGRPSTVGVPDIDRGDSAASTRGGLFSSMGPYPSFPAKPSMPRTTVPRVASQVDGPLTSFTAFVRVLHPWRAYSEPATARGSSR